MSANSSDNPAPDGQVLPQEVAELAGELTEAHEESRRRRLARQISGLAGRGRQAARPARRVATGGDVAV
ncbi:MAG: hypothetical protein J2P28_16580, partial [Actinobacteria bacterium]|nr:hypothetical protein [Actinomycetota bacterium]